jgi:hypothetical protein
MLDVLETLDRETLEPPESRIKNVQGVRARLDILRDGDLERMERRTKIQGLLDGIPPYNHDRMIQAGRGDDANINFREAEGKVAAAATPYYQLDFGVPRAVNVYLEYEDADETKRYEWAEHIANKVSNLVWGWRGYKINQQLSHYQMVVFGRGPIMWKSRRGFHFEAMRDDTVWVNDDARCDIDYLEEMAIPDFFEPVELWSLVEKGKKADTKEWDEELCKKAIINAAPKPLKDTYYDAWANWEASLRRGDIMWDNQSARIYYHHYLRKEFTGKITHCIVLDWEPSQERGGVADDFAFKKTGRYDSFHEIIVPFFFDVGPDATWYSVKGMGPKIYDSCDLSNRFWCTVINAAMTTSGGYLQAQNAQALQNIQRSPIVRSSGITFLPTPNDWGIPETPFKPDFQGPLSVIKGVNDILNINTGQYQSLENPPQPTATQEEYLIGRQSTLTIGAYDRYYHYKDDFWREMFRRIFDKSLTSDDPGGEEALEMREYLIEDCGIPEDALNCDYMHVTACRNVGYGSMLMQQVVNKQLLSLLPTMSERGRRNTLRSVGAALVNQDNVDRFWEPYDKIGIPTDHEALATIENNLFRSAGYEKLAVTPEQDHVIHFESHFASALKNVQQVAQGMGDPIELVRHLQNAAMNMHEHLGEIQGDPTRKNQVKKYTKMLMMLNRLAENVKKQVTKQMAQNQPAKPQITPEQIQELTKIQGELKIKETKMMMDEQRKDRKLAADMRRKDAQTAAGIYRANAARGTGNGM